MRIRLATGLVLSLVLLTAVPTHAGATGPAAFNLRSLDVPPGLMHKVNTNPTPAQAAKDDQTTVATLKKWGQVGYNLVEYTRDDPTSGIFAVLSTIEQFHTPPQAVAEYQRRVVRGLDDTSVTLHPMAINSLGSEHTAWTLTEEQLGVNEQVAVVFFVRGNYMVAVTIVGVRGTTDTSQLGRLAHIVDHRIQAHR
jgi:hypothetical protein